MDRIDLFRKCDNINETWSQDYPGSVPNVNKLNETVKGLPKVDPRRLYNGRVQAKAECDGSRYLAKAAAPIALHI